MVARCQNLMQKSKESEIHSCVLSTSSLVSDKGKTHTVFSLPHEHYFFLLPGDHWNMSKYRFFKASISKNWIESNQMVQKLSWERQAAPLPDHVCPVSIWKLEKILLPSEQSLLVFKDNPSHGVWSCAHSSNPWAWEIITEPCIPRSLCEGGNYGTE